MERRNKKRLAAIVAGLMLFACVGAAQPPELEEDAAAEPAGAAADAPKPGPAGLADVNALPLWLAEEPGARGEVVILDYESAVDKGTPAQARVYLPHGYNPNERYDVLFLWPGTDGSSETMLQTAHDCRMEDRTLCRLSVADILDRLIESGTIRPVLAVCVEEITRTDLRIARVDIQTVWDLVMQYFSTHASDETLSQEERREHFAFVGFSQGAVYTQKLAMAEYFDRFAYYASVSYGSSAPSAAAAVNASPYELELLYYLVGNEDDVGARPAWDSYCLMASRCREKVRAGDNMILREARLYIHTYSLVPVALADLLPRIWPGEQA